MSLPLRKNKRELRVSRKLILLKSGNSKKSTHSQTMAVVQVVEISQQVALQETRLSKIRLVNQSLVKTILNCQEDLQLECVLTNSLRRKNIQSLPHKVQANYSQTLLWVWINPQSTVEHQTCTSKTQTLNLENRWSLQITTLLTLNLRIQRKIMKHRTLRRIQRVQTMMMTQPQLTVVLTKYNKIMVSTCR